MILFSYDQIIKKLILSLKYYHIKDISLFLAERLANYITTNPLINLNHTGITYIPIHWIKKLFKK
jgi:predicted amidophosphoribosyltransferase